MRGLFLYPNHFQKGAQLTDVNVSGDSGLHGACAYCQPITVQYLLDRGAQCNQYNKEGNTPLHKTMVFRYTKMPLEPQKPITTTTTQLASTE